MGDLRRFFARVTAFLRPERAEMELGREVGAHLDQAERHHQGRGLTPEAARLAARREIGVDGVKNQQRDARSFPWLEDARQDVRHAWRALARAPGFTSVAIVTLALGIGANTAVFSVVNAALLKPLPYRDPSRLVMIWAAPPQDPGAKTRATGPEYLAWQRTATAFEVMGTEGQLMRDLNAGDNGEAAERVSVQRLQSSLFAVLGISPILGRAFVPDEERVGAPAPVVLLSEKIWDRRFNRDPGVLNRTIRLDGQPTTIIGVMPRAFSYLSNAGAIDLYAPFAFNATQVKGSGRGYAIAARLKPGVTLEQAQADMDAVVARVADELPAPSKGFQARVEPLHEAMYGDSAPALLRLEAIVGLVLLIACANVAGLLVARAVSRSTELAVRAAIGAGRLRIVRQLLTESALLALLGGVAGIAVAGLFLKVLIAISPAWTPRLDEVAIDGRVLLFTLLVSIVTGLVFGCLPAVQASRPDLVESLKTAAKGSTGSLPRHHVRSGLVILQIALAVILLVGSGLVLRSFVNVKTNDLGADSHGVLMFSVPFQGARYSQSVGPYQGYNLIEFKPIVASTIAQIWDAIQAVPGVQSAAGNSAAPFGGGGPWLSFRIEGRPIPSTEGEQALAASYQVVTPKYFTTLRIPIVRGRDFDDRDASNTPWGVIVNESMAKQFWPDEDPIGRRLTVTLVPDDQPREVIGVTRNARSSPYETVVAPAMYTLYTQQPPHTLGPIGTSSRNGMTFILRTQAAPAAVVAGIRRVMTGLDRDRPAAEVRTLEESISSAIEGDRYAAMMFGFFAGVAILLATIGLYGVVSHGVVHRTHEIGIRMALGAGRSDIGLLIVRDIAIMTAIGVAIGLGAAVALTGSIKSMLFGVTGTDPLTYAGVSLLMLTVALMAAWIPTYRATRVAPTVALRTD